MFKFIIGRSPQRSFLLTWFRVERKNIGKNALSTAPSVAPNTTKAEFRKRYRNLILNHVVLSAYWLGSLFLSIYYLSLSNSLAVTGLLVFSFLPLIYLFKNSYIRWLAQKVYIDWDNRHLPNRKTMSDYIHAVTKSPSVFFKFKL